MGPKVVPEKFYGDHNMPRMYDPIPAHEYKNSDEMNDLLRIETEINELRGRLTKLNRPLTEKAITPPPLPLDFKLKCLELAIKAHGIVGLETEHYTARADAFYDWLTGKDQTS